jgi:serine protease Do
MKGNNKNCMSVFLLLIFANISASANPLLPKSIDTDVLQSQRKDKVVLAVEEVAPSVVSIVTEISQMSFFGFAQTSSSDGSGVVIESSGIVLTNAHVVEQSHRIQVSFANGESYDAKLLGLASELDLAILQIQNEGPFPSVEIGSSSRAMLGEKVIAIGNPFGLGHTVTTGIISSINRPLETKERVYQEFLQTDASINPGNSGGPLLNLDGHLIGINTAIRADAEGIGFAIPVDRAMKVAYDLLEYGNVKIPWLGIDLVDVIYRTTSGRAVGPQVDFVHQGSLMKGDVLIRVDDKDINGRSDLNAYLSTKKIGATVDLKILRQGRITEVSLKTTNLPQNIVPSVFSQLWGIEVRNNRGVQITKMNSRGIFAQYRLRVGDYIVAFNGMPIDNIEELTTMLQQAKTEHRDQAIITIQRGGATGRVEFPI